MLFNSFHFVVFFPVVVILYFLLAARYRWAILLAASYYFYMCWKPEYVILIVASTLIDYLAGLRMGRLPEKRKRRKYLILSLVSNLGMLFGFKYLNFFSTEVTALLGQFNIFDGELAFDIVLPIAISFYTFQTLSYSIDIFRGDRQPERHLGIFALYVAFFPQLVAGPIERSTRLIPQLRQTNRFDYGRVSDGIKLMLWGFFKKLVIADRIAVFVDHAYSNPGGESGVTLLFATYLFAFQIYCDFSGYSDIAIGAARVLGYDLMVNFRRPYFAQSIGQFWQRWHISLSTWFRDYLYISLGGNRVSKWRWQYNIMIVFLLSGFWHGANWTFLIWGALHGAFLLVSRFTKPYRDKLVAALRFSDDSLVLKLIRIALTFHLVLLAWVFFRAESVGDAMTVLLRIVSINSIDLTADLAAGFNFRNVFIGWFELAISVASLVLLTTVELFQRKDSLRVQLCDRPVWLRWGLCYGLILTIIIFGVSEHAEFIYFQF